MYYFWLIIDRISAFGCPSSWSPPRVPVFFQLSTRLDLGRSGIVLTLFLAFHPTTPFPPPPHPPPPHTDSVWLAFSILDVAFL